MTDRSVLGTADVSDDELIRMVAALLEADPAAVVLGGVTVSPVDYDIPAITTAGRYWVRGNVHVDGDPRQFSIFVKHVQSWARSPFFADVPEEFRAMAEAGVPWRTEPLAYRSDLRNQLPDGLRMPRALGVYDLDETSAAVWLEEIPTRDVTWDLERFEDAARLLGRLAGSPAVARYATVGEYAWSLDTYLYGRLMNQVLPVLRADQVWQHPLIAGAFDEELRNRLTDAAGQAAAYVGELATFPTTTGHGDACPNNLLVSDEPGFTLIDFGFWQLLPVGFDLGQLLVGDVQLGLRSSQDLATRGEACLVAYHEGLADEGFQIPLDQLRRAHALHLLVFTGLSTLPVEFLEQEITPELEHLAFERAAIARHCLDLLDATA